MLGLVDPPSPINQANIGNFTPESIFNGSFIKFKQNSLPNNYMNESSISWNF